MGITKKDEILPQLPQSDSWVDQQRFNQAVLQTFSKLFNSTAADIERLEAEINKLME